eukprot:5319108-Lingulodinium_polyedra.AAC.1
MFHCEARVAGEAGLPRSATARCAIRSRIFRQNSAMRYRVCTWSQQRTVARASLAAAMSHAPR